MSWHHDLIHPIMSRCHQIKESFIAHIKIFCSGLRDNRMVELCEDHRWSDVTPDRPFSILSAGAPSRMAGWRLDFNGFSISSELLRTRIRYAAISCTANIVKTFFKVYCFCFTSQSQPQWRKDNLRLPPPLIPYIYDIIKPYHWMSGLWNAAVKRLTMLLMCFSC